MEAFVVGGHAVAPCQEVEWIGGMAEGAACRAAAFEVDSAARPGRGGAAWALALLARLLADDR